jgi:hypothetical protein
MNPGYLSAVLIAITVILLASGWRGILLNGVSVGSLRLFFICWVPLSMVRLDWHGNMIYASVLLLVFIGIAGWLSLDSSVERIHLLSVAVLVATCDFVFREVLEVRPFVSADLSPLMSASALSLIMLCLQRTPLQQIACLSLGLAAGDLMSHAAHAATEAAVYGGPRFQDHWWFAVVLSRLLTVTAETAYVRTKTVFRLWIDGFREGGR